MRKILPAFIAVGVVFLGAGVAAAEPATYEVADSWQLTYVDGRPTVVPHVEDDYVEVTCEDADPMADWSVNDEALVAGSSERVDGTGIQVQPHFTGQTETIEITVTCERR